jgi:hypothetical protein
VTFYVLGSVARKFFIRASFTVLNQDPTCLLVIVLTTSFVHHITNAKFSSSQAKSLRDQSDACIGDFVISVLI